MQWEPVLERVAGLEMQMFTSTSGCEDRRQSEYSRLWEKSILAQTSTVRKRYFSLNG